jgi:4a-hydroxytetrahydrobiopterin dehydratase
MVDTDVRLSRSAASAAVSADGWRYVLGALLTSVAVSSLADAARAAAVAVGTCGDDADAHLRVDLRADRAELSLQTRALAAVTDRDTRLALAVTRALAAAGHRTGGATVQELPRPVQALEVAIDALDVAAVRPFWAAVLGYTPQPGDEGLEGALTDPAGQLPTIWFQQMDAPRSQRNRIHFDIAVADDEAGARVAAALAAGGVLVSDAEARAFWILADVEGNEVCVCTWLDRDERKPLT